MRQHNLTHCLYQMVRGVCVTSKGKSDHYHRGVPQPMDGDVARIQMDFLFVGAEGTFVDEPRAKVTVLMVIRKDDCSLFATEVRTKTDEYGVEMVLRFLSTYEGVEIKTDGGAQHCRDRSESTCLTRQNNDSGTDECWRTPRDWSSGTCEWNSAGSVAGVLPGRARTHESESHSGHTVVSMDVAAFSLGGGALPVRSENETDPVRKNKRLSVRVSTRTVWRGGLCEDCRCRQNESRQAGQCLGQSGFGRPCEQIE